MCLSIMCRRQATHVLGRDTDRGGGEGEGEKENKGMEKKQLVRARRRVASSGERCTDLSLVHLMVGVGSPKIGRASCRERV